MSVMMIKDPLQDIPDINYNKKELATPFLVNDILEEPQSQVILASDWSRLIT